MPRFNKKATILEAARKLFSEKGYDSTGMEEIALLAGVPKSLIYYHYKNKEELLAIIIKEFLCGYERILQDDSQRGIAKISRYIQFVENNRDCARILLGESLKPAGNHHAAVFNVVDTLRKNDPEPLTHSHWVAEFFTSILPTLAFVCYSEGWCRYFDVQPEILEKDFLKTYELTHGAYHERINYF